MRRWLKGFKGLWAKGAGAEDLGQGETDDWDGVEADPKADVVDPLNAGLVIGESALAAGELDDALRSSRALLLAGAGDPRTLDFAARLMAVVDEPALAGLFLAAAANTGEAESLTALAAALVERQDWPLGLVLADAAEVRGGDEALCRVLAAEALMGMGSPEGALEKLDVFAVDARWPSLGVAELYGWAAVVAEDPVRLHTVRPTLVDSGECDWVLEAGERGQAYLDARDPARPLRDLTFERYGVLLVDEPAASSGFAGDIGGGELESIQALRLGRWMSMLATVLRPRLEAVREDARIAWVSPRSEVVARWLADAMGMTAMPLSARIPDQPIVVVTADDGDVDALASTPSFFNAVSLWVQVLKDPTSTDTPMPDVVCMWSSTATLPFEELKGEKATDRVPPRLLVSALQDQSRAIGSLTLSVFGQWADRRDEALTLSRARRPEERTLWVGGLSRPAIAEEPAAEVEEASEESVDADEIGSDLEGQISTEITDSVETPE